jgi:hypothetical protein
MSNMSDQSNETYESMILYIAELNLHVSNLSAMLNESDLRHHENVTLVDSLTTQQSVLSAELSNITSQLSVADLTIRQLRDEISRLSYEGEDYFLGLLNGSEPSTKFRDLNSVMLNPIHYGSPTLTIENQGFETYMNYSTSMNRSHTLWFELCNSSIHDGSTWFPRALGINYTSNALNPSYITDYNSTTLLNLTFDWFGRLLQTKTELRTLYIPISICFRLNTDGLVMTQSNCEFLHVCSRGLTGVQANLTGLSVEVEMQRKTTVYTVTQSTRETSYTLLKLVSQFQ